MKAKEVIVELYDAVDRTEAWISAMGGGAMETVLKGKVVTGRSVLRRLRRAMKTAYHECGIIQDRVDRRADGR